MVVILREVQRSGRRAVFVWPGLLVYSVQIPGHLESRDVSTRKNAGTP